MKPRPTLTLWDSSEEPPDDAGIVYLWSGHRDQGSARSLLRYVERNGDRLRCDYLAWIHEVGERMVRGRRLVDHLAFDDGLSYWWLTGIVEQNPYRAPITDALRLIAVEEIVHDLRPHRMRLVSSDSCLGETLRDLCRGLQIEFEWVRSQANLAPARTQAMLRRLPHFLQGLRTLARQLRFSLIFRKEDTSGWFEGDRTVFVCGYFVNVSAEAASEGRFYSSYWQGLHGLLRKMGISGNWLHHSPAIPAATAVEWVRRFNRNREECGFHAFLNSFLSSRIVLRVLGKWLHLYWVSWRLGSLEDAFRTKRGSLSLWTLLKEDWESCLRGEAAISNLLFIELIDAAMRELPYSVLGLYLCENNQWERALIHSWRKHGHGRLIGVAHSTVRFWDLRYFLDIRTLRASGSHRIPQPDAIALNGRAAVEALAGVGFPEDSVIECEALRYTHLGSKPSASTPDRGTTDRRRVLIIGDISPSLTTRMLELFSEASQLDDVDLTLKPHPACPVEPGGLSELKLKSTSEPLSSILGDYDIACASITTSGAVDAFYRGLPVIVVLDEAELNLSPLRGQPRVRFVSTAEELVEAILGADLEETRYIDSEDLFFLSPDLPRWQRILSTALVSSP